ncbi:MAG: thioesterase [Halioglobus sp.]|nr:thioesterase [Halioglobus sp.]
MREQESAVVPEGFEIVPEGFGFIDVLQPLYRRVEGDSVSFGLVVQEQHCNSMGICHGAVLMTLADVVAASGVNHACGVLAGNPTLNIAVDFISAAQRGQWIQGDAEQVSLKRRFGFASGTVYDGARGIVARFNGTIYLPGHDGVDKSGRRDSPLGSPPG